MSADNQVAVVIVNWNLADVTIDCIHSILASRGVDPAVIVIDNGSTDDSVAKIKRTFQQINVVQNPHNLGFSGGYNEGIRHALQTKARRILLINNDTIVEPDAIGFLMARPESIVIPRILFHDRPGMIWAAGAQWRGFPPGVVITGYRRPDGAKYQIPRPLQYATGCALLVDRAVFDQVSGFDPDFENYNEDYDFFFRARQAGFSVFYEPEAVVYHRVSLSLGQQSPRRWWYLGRNTVLFFRKNRRFPVWQLYFNVGWVSLREVVKGNFRQALFFVKGARDGANFLASRNG